MLKKKIFYWGAKGTTLETHDAAKNNFKVIGLFDRDKSLKTPFKGLKNIHEKSALEKWLKKNKKNCYFYVNIGSHNKTRVKISNYLKKKGLKAASIIHDNAYVSKNTLLGEGIAIFAKTIVQPKSKIGNYVILNTNASISHECEIKEGVHIAPGAILCGNVVVEKYCFIGAGAILLPKIKIGENTIVGAGSVVTKDVPKNCITYGNPSRIRKINN